MRADGNATTAGHGAAGHGAADTGLHTMTCIVLLHLLGYALKSLGGAGSRAEASIGFLIAHVTLPALIFSSVARLDVTSLEVDLIGAIFCAKLCILVIGVLAGSISTPHATGSAAPAAGARLMRSGAVALFVTQSDDLGLGLPFLGGLFEPRLTRTLVLLAAMQNLLISPVAYVLMGLGRAQSAAAHSLAAASKPADASGVSARAPRLSLVLTVGVGVLTNPLVASALLGLAFNALFGPSLPWFIPHGSHGARTPTALTALFSLSALRCAPRSLLWQVHRRASRHSGCPRLTPSGTPPSHPMGPHA
jgi:predicted permease